MRLKYWIEHPTQKIWMGPFKDIEKAKKYAKHVANESGKAVQLFSEDQETGATKALEKLRRATTKKARK